MSFPVIGINVQKQSAICPGLLTDNTDQQIVLNIYMRKEAPIIDLKLESEFTKCGIFQIYDKNIGKASHFSDIWNIGNSGFQVNSG